MASSGHLAKCLMSCWWPSGSFGHCVVPSGVATSSRSLETSIPITIESMRLSLPCRYELARQRPRRLFGLNLTKPAGILLPYGLRRPREPRSRDRPGCSASFATLTTRSSLIHQYPSSTGVNERYKGTGEVRAVEQKWSSGAEEQ